MLFRKTASTAFCMVLSGCSSSKVERTIASTGGRIRSEFKRNGTQLEVENDHRIAISTPVVCPQTRSDSYEVRMPVVNDNQVGTLSFSLSPGGRQLKLAQSQGDELQIEVDLDRNAVFYGKEFLNKGSFDVLFKDVLAIDLEIKTEVERKSKSLFMSKRKLGFDSDRSWSVVKAEPKKFIGDKFVSLSSEELAGMNPALANGIEETSYPSKSAPEYISRQFVGDAFDPYKIMQRRIGSDRQLNSDEQFPPGTMFFGHPALDVLEKQKYDLVDVKEVEIFRKCTEQMFGAVNNHIIALSNDSPSP